MIRYKLMTQHGEVVVTCDSGQPNRESPLRFVGSDMAVLAVRRWLVYETGACGHPIGEWAAPNDLKVAMGRPGSRGFSPVLLEEVMGQVNGARVDAEGGG